MTTLKNWILATRPKTLVACFIPIMCATSLVFKINPQSFVWMLTLCAFLSALCIQIGTNFINDAIDFKKGADTQDRLGPTRVSQSGLIEPNRVLKVGVLFFILAVLFGIPLVLKGGIPIMIIGILSILCGYCYTGGSYPIAYNGLGELFVFLFFGFVAVCGLYFLQMNTIHGPAIVLGLQIGALSSVILAINNYRDIVTDQIANKMTLAARFGETFAKYEILFLYALVYGLNFYWYVQYGLSLLVLTSLTLPIAVLIVCGVFNTKPSKEINKYLGMAALVELLFGVLISAGFLYFL